MNESGARPVLAYVVLSLNPGGTERLVVDMARTFASTYEVNVFCLDEPGDWATVLRESGIPVHVLWRRPGLDLSLALRLAAHLRACGAHIVHAHQCTPWFYSALARLLYPLPRLLLEEHGRFHPEVDKPLRRIVNRWLIAPLTHRFVAVSKDIRSRLERYEGISGDRISVVYNGVAPAPALDARERERLRARLGFSAGDFVVGTVGRLDPIKNLPMLVAALERAMSGVPHLRGLIVGDGPLREETADLIGKAGLSATVLMTGHRDDARSLVQCMDLFVLSSLSEGTSMALLEAMAAQVAVAVTDVGGNPEIVDAGAGGWVVPSGDAAALANVIEGAANDTPVRERVAQAGRDRFVERFGFDDMVDTYRQIYRELLDRGQALPADAGA